MAAVSSCERIRGDFGLPGSDTDNVVLGAEVENLLRPECILLCREGQMYMIEAVSGRPRLTTDVEEGAEGCGIRSAAPEMESVEVATDDPTETVAVGIAGVITGDRAEIHLDHAVLSEGEQPDVQTQLDGEAGKRSPCGGGIGSRGHGLLPTVEIHVVEEQGCCRLVFRVVHDSLPDLVLKVGYKGGRERGRQGPHLSGFPAASTQYDFV